ncbi:MAG: homoserine kinase [Caulobacteraceae bacterium]
MAVYTDIADGELDAFLAGFDVGDAVSFKGIAEGVENSNFLLETTRGRFILTIYERRVRAEDLPFFLGLMRWLAEHGYPSATPVADREGRMLGTIRGKPAALVAFLAGMAVRRPTADHCREAGEGLAWLHRAAEGFGGRRANDLGQAGWSALFAPLAPAAEGLKPGLAATIAADLRQLAADWPTGLPEGIVHGDYFPDNVFFRQGRFAATIDFYFAARDILAYDIGVALNAWCFEADGSFNVTLARAFVEGYRRRRTLGEAEKAALPLLARGAAMRFFLTRLNDWGATPSGSLVRPKDPLEYERKLAVHREAARGGGGLALFSVGPAA